MIIVIFILQEPIVNKIVPNRFEIVQINNPFLAPKYYSLIKK